MIADDHQLVADAYKAILEPENEVLGVVVDGRALLRDAAKLQPQIVITDITMPLLNGLDAAQQLKHKMPGIKIVFVTMNQDSDLVAEAFRRGASAYLPKTSAGTELLQAIREVMNGRTYLSPLAAQGTIASLLRQDKTDGTSEALTDRQREVIQLLAEGKSMKEAASLLNMTVRTVAFHKYRIMKKLALQNNSELIQYAIRNHMIAA
ncbi:MAG TPA: response regulator transcription factor [Terriglobales bacterium]